TYATQGELNRYYRFTCDTPDNHFSILDWDHRRIVWTNRWCDRRRFWYCRSRFWRRLRRHWRAVRRSVSWKLGLPFFLCLWWQADAHSDDYRRCRSYYEITSKALDHTVRLRSACC